MACHMSQEQSFPEHSLVYSSRFTQAAGHRTAMTNTSTEARGSQAFPYFHRCPSLLTAEGQSRLYCDCPADKSPGSEIVSTVV